MTFVVRAAGPRDLPAIYDMARSTGGGLTNLPSDQGKLAEKLDTASAAFIRKADTLADDRFMFVLEDHLTKTAHGTCQIFSKIGEPWPFYSYRIDALAQHCSALDRTIRSEMLTLCTDHTGCTEVAGLFLNPSARSAGTGSLLARSRYLFIRMHRIRFADCTIAELRGVANDRGEVPFWDGIGGRFFGMTFFEADEFNAVNGNQFISDLMPKSPLYLAVLAESARQVIGQPHLSGVPAMRMLEKEGFVFSNYIDIFDGGPTMAVATDKIATILDAKEDIVCAIAEPLPDGIQAIIATGALSAFRACQARISIVDGGIAIDCATAEVLQIRCGARITYVAQ